MKKKIVGILVCMLVIATALPAVGIMNKNKQYNIEPLIPPSVEWNLTYDRGEFDEIRYIQQTPEGGYIGCGLTEESNNYYIMLVKLDSDGDEEWHVVNYDLNGTYIDPYAMDVIAFHILVATDGGFLISGNSVISDEVQGETVWTTAGFLWKTNATGATQWIQHYYSVEELYVEFIYESLEIPGGFVVTGSRIYFDLTGSVTEINGFLLKTDIVGTLEWSVDYDTGGDDHFSTLCSTKDDGYLLTGFTDSSSVKNGALWMVKTNGTGAEQWEKIFDGPGFEYYYGKGCFQTSDDGYIMCGNTGSYGNGMVDVWVIKTDSSGNEEWNRTYGYTHYDYTWAMTNTSDGDYVIAICKDYQYAGGTRDDIWIVEFNENGDTEWSYLIEETGKQIPSGIKQTDDKGFIISGRTNEYGVSSSDGIVLKISPFPHLDIKIKGGIGVRITITNNGLGDAIGVPYEITVTGGFLGTINKTKNGTIDILAGESKTVSTGLFFGIGHIKITVKVAWKEMSEEGTHFIILSIV